MKTLIVVVGLVAAIGVGVWYSSTGHQRHVTSIIEQAYVDIGIDSNDVSYFNYFRQDFTTACSHVENSDDRWQGTRAAEAAFPSIDELPAATELADQYEADGWVVSRFVKPPGAAIPESRKVEAVLGEDLLQAFFTEDSVSISVNSGPCIVDTPPETDMGNFGPVDRFGS